MTKYDPSMVVPPEILKKALEIDQWARELGFDTYCIGPVCSRSHHHLNDPHTPEPECVIWIAIDNRIDYLVQSQLSGVYSADGKTLGKWITDREFPTREAAEKHRAQKMAQEPGWPYRVVRRQFILTMEDGGLTDEDVFRSLGYFNP